MKGLRATKSIRLLLAAIALAGSVGSSPVIGHAHGTSTAETHDHHGWADHDHALPHAEESDDHGLAFEAGESVFHLHGSWFGIPFSLPAPSGEVQVEGTSAYLAFDFCLAPANAPDLAHPQWEPSCDLLTSWLLYPLCAPSGPPSLLTAFPSDRIGTAGLLLLRSVNLRC